MCWHAQPWTHARSILKLIFLIPFPCCSLNEKNLYDYLIINDNLDEAVEKLRHIADRCLQGLDPEPGQVPESVIIEDVGAYLPLGPAAEACFEMDRMLCSRMVPFNSASMLFDSLVCMSYVSTGTFARAQPSRGVHTYIWATSCDCCDIQWRCSPCRAAASAASHPCASSQLSPAQHTQGNSPAVQCQPSGPTSSAALP
jgi:hypothetical protein